MSDKIKFEIEITSPPEGWGEIEYRKVLHEEDTAMLWDGQKWQECHGQTGYSYPVARKLPPPWTPPPEFSVLRPGWIAMNWNKYWFWFDKKPLLGTSSWECTDSSDKVSLRAFKISLFPQHIHWNKSCFKIGEPDE